MMPGQKIGVHTDRPLVGEEFVRMVLQLNEDWPEDAGGMLCLYSSLESEPDFEIKSSYNKAFLFVLNPDSYHSVCEVRKVRRTVVFNFWHAANTPALAKHIEMLFDGAHFSQLPDHLDQEMELLETHCGERVSMCAGMTALLLNRWKAHPSDVLRGLQFSAGLLSWQDIPASSRAVIGLAEWAAWMRSGPFLLSRWRRLCNRLRGERAPNHLQTLWALCCIDAEFER